MMIRRFRNNKHYIYGIAASIVMLAFYIGIMLIFNPLYYVIEDFISKFIWFSILITLFGVQIGLITYIRNINNKRRMSKSQTALSGGISTTSMLACCIHHVTDFIPLIGVSAFTAFLVEFQLYFLIIGILFGVLSVLNIMIHIQKHSVYEIPSIFESITKFDLIKLRKIFLGLFILIGIVYSLYIVNDIFNLGGVL
ncbi:MAG: hypothetical protein ACVCEJ_05855 [Candidatus Izemoplasmataceae bacterium]